MSRPHARRRIAAAAALLTVLAAPLVGTTKVVSTAGPTDDSAASGPFSLGAPVDSTAAGTVVTPGAAGVTVARRVAVLPARWSTLVAERGETGVVVRGRVGGAVREVVLQAHAGHRWVVRQRTWSHAGRYVMPVPTATVGQVRYRVVAPVSRAQRLAGLVRAVSATRTFTVARPWADPEPGPSPEPTPSPTPSPSPEPTPPPGPGTPAQEPSTALGDPTDFTLLISQAARWNPCTTIDYRVNTTYGPPSALKDTHEAVARIEQASGLDFEYAGTTDIIPQDGSASNYPAGTELVIAWASRAQSPMLSSDDVAGVGGPTGSGGTVDEDGVPVINWRRGTVVLNSRFNSSLPAGFGTGATVGKLLMHEIGHVVGLGHAAGRTQVMFPTLLWDHAAVWGAGDLTGLRLQGASQGCLFRPDGTLARAREVTVVSQIISDSAEDLLHGHEAYSHGHGRKPLRHGHGHGHGR